MIILNNKKFARTEKEFKAFLFESGGACVGYYKPYKRRIVLMDIQKKRIGIICNRVIGEAFKLKKGKYWYSYMRPAILGDSNIYPGDIMNEDLDRIYKQYPMPVKY